MSYHHGLAGFDPAPFETMAPGEWTGQGVDPTLNVDPSRWNPTLSADPAHINAVNQMLANGTNPVTGKPTALNVAVLGKGYRWQGAGDIVDPNTGATVGNAFVLGLSGVQALPTSQRGDIAPSPEAVEFQPPPTYVGPPTGWHAGELDGVTGYWAPDGLFYAGAAPWETYTPGSGKSIHTSSSGTPAPLLPSGSPTNASGGGGAATMAPAGDAHPEPVVLPFGDPPAIEYVQPDGPTPLTPGIPDDGTGPAPTTSGLSSMTMLVIGGAVVGAMLLARKRS